jgi:hypothetical protein
LFEMPSREPATCRRYYRAPEILSRFFVHIFRRTLSDRFIRVRYRRWNYVSAAGPLAKINGAATVTAEGKLGIAALHRFLADRAAELQGTFARHGPITQRLDGLRETLSPELSNVAMIAPQKTNNKARAAGFGFATFAEK